jgi:cyclohexadieny/prephenate dehydrogenase
VTNHIAILAPGLLGASVAQAARHFGAAQRITLWARRPETRQELKGQTWCDHVADSAADAVKGAQLTIICSPVDQIIPLLTTIAPHLAAGSFVTDVGSVKTEICQKGHAAIFPHAHFVGSHPMAGSEKTGWAHARPDLFVGRTVFVTPRPDTAPAATAHVALSGLRWRVRLLR